MDYAQLQELGAILLRVLLSMTIGACIGLNREIEGHPAGIRTHMLLVMGATLFTLAGRSFGTGDPSRVAAQIVTGIGFLGAGAIFKMGTDVRGLTTAATVWASAAIGVFCGLAQPVYLVAALIATVLILVTLSPVKWVEERFIHSRQRGELFVSLHDPSALGPVVMHLTHLRNRIVGLHFLGEDRKRLSIRVSHREQVRLEEILALEGVLEAHWNE